MEGQRISILFYGIGNPGRQDDALGIILAGEIESWGKQKKISNLEITQNYQLNIEDAELISHFDKVFFADASVKTDKPFELEKIEPALEADFSTHLINPPAILGLCHSLFCNKVEAFQLHIRGLGWEFMKPLTNEARKNAELAINFIKKELEKDLVLKELRN